MGTGAYFRRYGARVGAENGKCRERPPLKNMARSTRGGAAGSIGPRSRAPPLSANKKAQPPGSPGAGPSLSQGSQRLVTEPPRIAASIPGGERRSYEPRNGGKPMTAMPRSAARRSASCGAIAYVASGQMMRMSSSRLETSIRCIGFLTPASFARGTSLLGTDMQGSRVGYEG